MKNKFLINFVTLIVFLNFTIPSYALAAPQKAFSRNAAVKVDAPATDAKDASGFIGAINKEADGSIPAYSYPSAKDLELAEYVLPSVKVLGEMPSGSFPESGEFTEIPAGLEGVAFSDVAWGDYNNDGFLDIVLGGFLHNSTSTNVLYLYKNNGNGTFLQVADTGLLPTKNDRISWVDYDNDGYLDLSVQGNSSDLRIYHNNNGNGTFANTVTIPNLGFSSGEHAWGDYDNDGDPDLVVGFTTGVKIFRNDGNNIFTDINASLQQLSCISVALGDFDNDGRVDIAYSGYYGSPFTWVTKLYRNDGLGSSGQWQFTDIDTSLSVPFSAIGDLSWGDYNNDGKLDILIASNMNSKIFRNDGPGSQPNTWQFTNTNIPLVGFYMDTYPSLSGAWGDYDDDGDLDILLTGEKYELGTSISYSAVYRNDGNDIFVNINAGLQGVSDGGGFWGDYDNDGDLDIALVGKESANCGYTGTARVYRNNLGSNASVVNTIPNAPTSPQANVSNSNVTLSWQKATDAQTPQNGLNYNIFIGTTPNSVDIESPMAQLSNGWRKIAALGSQNENTSWTIKNLSNGTYYWGVQAIDTAFAGSPFVTGSFTIGGPTTFTLTYTAGAGGSISGLTPQTVNYNGSGTEVIAVPNTGYSFVSWSDGQTSASRTDANVIANLNVTANFAINTFTLTYTAGAGGSISGETPQTVNYNGSGTEVIAVPNTGYSFVSWSDGQTSASRTDANIVANLNVTANFEISVFTVSGTVLTSGGQVPSGATVNGVPVDPVTGFYSIANIAYGTAITLVPSAIGYIFTPPNATLTVMSNMTQNFIGELIYFNITGMVHTPNGQGAGFSMNVTNNNPNLPAVASTVTQSDGTYALSVPYGWSGIVTAAKAGYIIVHPENAQYTYENVLSDQAEKNYKSVLERYTISGLIEYANGSGPVEGVQLKDDADNVLATTDASGFYSFEEDYGWSAVVRPYKDNHVFDPVEREYIDLQSNQVDQHYKAKKISIVISGHIVSSPNDVVLAGVVLKDQDGTILATTDMNGAYSFEKPIGWSGVVTPSKPKYAFTPKQRKYEDVQTNLSEEHYVATRAGDISHL